MHKRKEPRDIPDRPPYFGVDLEGRPVHHMRYPSAWRLAVLHDLANASDPTALRQAAAAGKDAIEMATELAATQGAVIGLFWAGRDVELDAKLPTEIRPGDLVAYGRAVHDELHDAGYTLAEIATLWAACLRRVVEQSAEVRGVMSALGFSRARPAGSTESPASQDSNSSATTSPS